MSRKQSLGDITLTTQDTPDGKRKRRAPMWWFAAVVVAAFAPYALSMNGGFVLDDQFLILEDPLAHSLSHIPQAFTVDFLHRFGKNFVYYRPLVTISYQLNYVMFGPHPLGFRITNVALHALTAVLVFLLARRLTGSALAAGVAGVLFAVQPSHSESVNWISGRTDILAGLFMLASFLLFIKHCRRLPSFNWPIALGCSLLFTAGLFSKEISLALPGLFVLYVWVYRTTIKREDVLKWAAVLVPSLVIYMLMRRHVLGVAVDRDMFLFAGRRVYALGVIYASYLRMLFLPSAARVLYDTVPSAMEHPVIAWVGWIAPLALVVATVWLRRIAATVALCAGWILIALLPVSNLIPTTGPVPADRFVYVASIGSSIMFGWLAWRLYEFRPRSIRTWPLIAVALTCGSVLYCGMCTVEGNQYWHTNPEWAEAIGRSGTRFTTMRVVAAGHMNRLGLVYVRAGKIDEGMTIMKRAAEIAPEFPTPWRNMGKVSVERGRYLEAIDYYRHVAAMGGLRPEDRRELGLAYEGAGMKKEAAELASPKGRSAR